MPDKFGIAVSQRGRDVKTAADYQMLFSSNWPTLPIGLHGTFSLSDGSLDQDIVTHNFGYYPLCWVFLTHAGTYWTNGASRLAESEAPAVSPTKLRWLGANFSEAASPVTGYYYIFRRDLLSDYVADTIVTNVGQPGPDEGFGLDISKRGKGISSTDYRDFVTEHATRTPLIHKTGTGSGASLAVTHGLGYVPLYFVYRKVTVSSTDYYVPVHQTQSATHEATTTTITFGTAGSSDFAYVILKDPFEIDT